MMKLSAVVLSVALLAGCSAGLKPGDEGTKYAVTVCGKVATEGVVTASVLPVCVNAGSLTIAPTGQTVADLVVSATKLFMASQYNAKACVVQPYLASTENGFAASATAVCTKDANKVTAEVSVTLKPV